MMRTFERLLVHVDPAAPRQPALERAVRLADEIDAAMTIAAVVEDRPKRARADRDEVTDLVHRHVQERLEALAADVRRRSRRPTEVATRVLVGKPAIEIVREVLRGNHDVLLRAHAAPVPGRRSPFDAVDMQLLRKCPCPVWLVGPSPAPYRRVLAAVDPAPDDPVEQGLNRKILDLALFLAGIDRADLIVLHVWSAFGEELVGLHAGPAEVQAYVDAARAAAQADLDALVDPYRPRLGRARLVLEKGEPGHVIPEFARAEGVDLVVMGTVARTGLAGFIMGNTAERVLGALACSVLTVKPDGFVSPVTLD
jgi:universal stress protein E